MTPKQQWHRDIRQPLPVDKGVSVLLIVWFITVGLSALGGVFLGWIIWSF